MVAQCTEYVLWLLCDHTSFFHIFSRASRAEQTGEGFNPARHPQQLPQRTKKALSTLRSNFAFTGRNITDEPKNKANNIQYIASQCFIHTGDPEPKPLDVFDHRPTGLITCSLCKVSSMIHGALPRPPQPKSSGHHALWRMRHTSRQKPPQNLQGCSGCSASFLGPFYAAKEIQITKLTPSFATTCLKTL